MKVSVGFIRPLVDHLNVSYLYKKCGVYYFSKRISNDLKNLYIVKRLCFSLKTKSNSTALRYAKSVTQRLDDYWFGIRLQNLDVPAINSLKKENEDNELSLIHISEPTRP